MSRKEKHTVHQSLVEDPTFGGVPRGQFFIEVAVCLLIFNIFRASIMTVMLTAGFYFGIHRPLKSAYKRDPMLVELWLMKLFKNQSYYPPQPDINAGKEEGQPSIPSNL